MYATRTEWFDGKTQVPAHEGVYERKYPAGTYFCYWDGRRWGQAGIDEKSARSWGNKMSNFQAIPFRGLKVKP